MQNRPSYRQIALLAIALLLLLQGFRFATFYSLQGHTDLSFQLDVAANWQRGHGFAVSDPQSSPDAEAQYTFLVGWPPGYSMLAAGLNNLVQDWIVTSRIIRGFALLLVLFSGVWIAHFLLKKIEKDYLKKGFLVLLGLFYGFSFAPFYYPEVTGLICFGLLLVAIASWLYMQEGRKPLGYLILAAVCMGLMPWFRFAYVPFMAVLPASLGLMWFLSKRNPKEHSRLPFLRFAGLSLIIEALIYLPLYLHQQSQVGALSHLAFKPLNKGFDLNRLVPFDPFPIKGFLFADPDAFAAKQSLISLEVFQWFFWIISAVILGLTCWFLWKKKNSLRIPAAILVMLPVVMLTYLSMRYPPEINIDGTEWTFVQETRYYIPAMIIFHIAVFGLSVRFWKWGKYAMILLTLLVSLHYGNRMRQRYIQHDLHETSQSEFDVRLRHLANEVKASKVPVYFVFDEHASKWREEAFHILAAYGAKPILSQQADTLQTNANRLILRW